MTDRELVKNLIAGDTRTISYFFFERCYNALSYIGQYFCQTKQTPEELIGEFYEFLSANDWHKLRIFQFTCSLNSYITIIASRYFQHKRDKELLPLDDNIGTIKEIETEGHDTTFFMNDFKKVMEKLPAFDRFLVQRILIDGEKPGDILDEAEKVMKADESISTNAQDKKQLAGYIYTRYNRARKSLQKTMIAIGYGR